MSVYLCELVLLGIIRFWNINQRGLFYHDEAAFIGNARFYGDLGRFFVTQILTGTFDFSQLINKAYEIWYEGGNPWQNASPLMYFFFIAVAFLTGSQEVPCMLISAMAGLLNTFINFEQIISILTAQSPYRIVSEKIIADQKNKKEIFISDKEISANDKPILRWYLKRIIKKDKASGNLFVSTITSRHDFKDKAEFIEKNYTPIFVKKQKLNNGMVLEDGLVYDLIEEYKANKDNFIRIYDLEKSK